MGSSRLPGKVLMDSGLNKTFLECLVERIRKVDNIDDVIIATTTNMLDDEIEHFCQEKNITFYRGSEENVMERVLLAAEQNKVDIIVEITGDCPFIDSELISQNLNTFLSNSVDYLSNAHFRSYPDGMDVQIFTTKCLNKAFNDNPSELDKEHVTLKIRNDNRYSKIHIVAPKSQMYPELGLTLDDERDLILLKKIASYFNHNNFGLNQVLELLFLKHPEWISINKDVIRKGDT